MEINPKTKALVTILLAGTIVTAFTLQVKNGNLFKGQLADDSQINTETTPTSPETITLLPDLTAEVTTTMPVDPAGDITANITIKNNGPGKIDGKTPFKYILSVNGTEVMSNTDSYTTMESGDAFSFSYPISRSIYEYKNIGKIKFIVDSENKVKEANEDNNMQETDY